MESPLDYLKNSAENDWLIDDGSNKFSQLATQLYLELSQLLTQGTAPKILLAHSAPIDFLAGFIAACAAGCPVFLCNPNWVKHEWQQVFELVQPDLIWGDRPEVKKQPGNYPNQNLESKIQNRIMIPKLFSTITNKFILYITTLSC